MRVLRMTASVRAFQQYIAHAYTGYVHVTDMSMQMYTDMCIDMCMHMSVRMSTHTGNTLPGDINALVPNMACQGRLGATPVPVHRQACAHHAVGDAEARKDVPHEDVPHEDVPE